MHSEPVDSGGKVKERARGPKDIILNPVKQLKRLFGPKEPYKDHSRKLTEAAEKPRSPQEGKPSGGSSGSDEFLPMSQILPATGKLYHVAHKVPEGNSKGTKQAAVSGQGGGIVRPAVARAAEEAGSREGLQAYEQEADKLKEALDRGGEPTAIVGSEGSSGAMAFSRRPPAGQATASEAGDPMKEALTFYEREADMLKERVLASRQALFCSIKT